MAAALICFMRVNNWFSFLALYWFGSAVTDPGERSIEDSSWRRSSTAEVPFLLVWPSIITSTTRGVFTMFRWWPPWHGSRVLDSWREERCVNHPLIKLLRVTTACGPH